MSVLDPYELLNFKTTQLTAQEIAEQQNLGFGRITNHHDIPLFQNLLQFLAV